MPSKAASITGWVLTGIFALFMIVDVGIKFLQLPIVEETMAQLGYPPGLGFPIGIIEGIALVLYLIPRTSVLGAVLFTGVFGGAIATHMRVGSPFLSHTFFGIYLGLVAWGGLWLRDLRLRALFPMRSD